MENIRVAVRVRPLLKNEISNNEKNAVKITDSTLLITNHVKNTSKQFTFDYIFGPDYDQNNLYDTVGKPLVENVLSGYNGTIIAYGQTGAGKSFTMFGSSNQYGIIPLACSHIFDHINKSDNKKFLVRASYLEVYNEEINDLLSKETNKKLEVKERPESGVYIKNLATFIVNNKDDLINLIQLGNKNRATGLTNMNEHSSRSHAIFSITVECNEQLLTVPIDNPGNKKDSSHTWMGKLHLVDLAGSERLDKSQADTHGQKRLRETTKINFSLSCLGNVVCALLDAQRNKSRVVTSQTTQTSNETDKNLNGVNQSGTTYHIPYRDSKLTHILKDSLGGNSKTIMIANIGPAESNYEESISTLRYAQRVKSIQNKAIINEDPKDALLKRYQTEIDALKQLLQTKDNEPILTSEQFDGGEKQDKSSKATKKKKSSLKTLELNLAHERDLITQRKDLHDEEKQILERKLAQRETQLLDARLERDALTQKLNLLEQKICIGHAKNASTLLNGSIAKTANRGTGDSINKNGFYKPYDNDKNVGINDKDHRLEELINSLEYGPDIGTDVDDPFNLANIERQLRATEAELEDRTKRRQELSTVLQQTQATKTSMEMHYEALKDQLKTKNEKCTILLEELVNAKSKLKDIKREHAIKVENLRTKLAELDKDNKLYAAIVDDFLPKSGATENEPLSTQHNIDYQELIRKYSTWNASDQTWQVKCIAYTGNHLIDSDEEDAPYNQIGNSDFQDTLNNYDVSSPMPLDSPSNNELPYNAKSLPFKLFETTTKEKSQFIPMNGYLMPIKLYQMIYGPIPNL